MKTLKLHNAVELHLNGITSRSSIIIMIRTLQSLFSVFFFFLRDLDFFYFPNRSFCWTFTAWCSNTGYFSLRQTDGQIRDQYLILDHDPFDLYFLLFEWCCIGNVKLFIFFNVLIMNCSCSETQESNRCVFVSCLSSEI